MRVLSVTVAAARGSSACQTTAFFCIQQEDKLRSHTVVGVISKMLHVRCVLRPMSHEPAPDCKQNCLQETEPVLLRHLLSTSSPVTLPFLLSLFFSSLFPMLLPSFLYGFFSPLFFWCLIRLSSLLPSLFSPFFSPFLPSFFSFPFEAVGLMQYHLIHLSKQYFYRLSSM